MYIKYILVLFSFFVFLSSMAYAEHKEVDKSAIKALISKVKIVEPSQRRVLINELKVMLRSMHQETRVQVMLDLRRSFNNKNGQSTTSAKQSNMHHQSTMSMTESKHMQENMAQCNMPQCNMPKHSPSIPKQPGQNPPMRGM
jgi:hypothetical protein